MNSLQRGGAHACHAPARKDLFWAAFHSHTHTRARAHTHTHIHTHVQTNTRTRTHTHTLSLSVLQTRIAGLKNLCARRKRPSFFSAFERRHASARASNCSWLSISATSSVTATHPLLKCAVRQSHTHTHTHTQSHTQPFCVSTCTFGYLCLPVACCSHHITHRPPPALQCPGWRYLVRCCSRCKCASVT